MNHRETRNQQHRKRWLLILGGVAALCLALVVAAYFLLFADLPDPEDMRRVRARETTKILDREGRVLYEWLDNVEGKHTYVSLDRIPLALQQATIATEDASFYTNPGVDVWSILRSAYYNLSEGEIVSGASTITQQTGRIVLMPEERWERTWRRKLREAYLAWRISRAFSKDEVLELYLNLSYYGNYAYGVEAAAEAYFAKRAEELDLAECALLTGLLQAPVHYNPLTNMQGAKERQAIVLGLMVEQGYISRQEADLAAAEDLRFAATAFDILAPHFVMYVRQQLEGMYGVEAVAQGGWRVLTSLDADMQRRAEEIVRYRLELLSDPNHDGVDHNVRNAAAVVMDPNTGEILAMVGSPDYFDAAIDGAVNAALSPRQPGSSLKPFTYAAALSQGYTPASVILDVRRSFLTAEEQPFVPINYDRRFYGPISLRRALATSSNVAAVSVLNEIGISSLINLAQRMGITWEGDLERFGLSLTLGGGEVRLLDLTAAYAGLARQGVRVEPVSILSIEGPDGSALYARPAPSQDRVLDARVAYLITDILADDKARAPAFGERSVLYVGRPAAVKTGTTTDWRDNWTVGYTPDLVVGVWAGNADNEPMIQVSGITGAAPIWHQLMVELLKGKSASAFPRPSGIVEVEVCPESGLLPGPHCPNRRYELFIEGTEPAQSCSAHRIYRIDTATGALASATTPAERVAERLFWVLPPEAQEWAREQGIPQPPAGATPLPEEGASIALEIISPDPNAEFVISGALPLSAQSIEIAARWRLAFAPREVTLFLDGEPLIRLSQPPYSHLWNLAPGAHVVEAEAVDADGRRWSSAPLRFTVTAGG